MAPFERIKDYSEERATFGRRALLALFLVCAVFVILVARIYYLQVVEYERYTAISERNRVQLQPVPPRRGLIYDRNGVLLADNQPTFSVTLLREEIRNMEETLQGLADLIEITDRDVDRFRQRMQQRRRPYETVPLRFRLTDEEIARLAVNYHRFPGVQVEADLIRYYPYGSSLVHALGYVGRINERELEHLDPVAYAGSNYIGKLGIEKFYESVLHGRVGWQKVETNARGRVLRILEREDPVPGEDLVLSLDLRLQQFAESLLEGKRGAIVAIEPETGGILALVSTPAYDPNLFVTGISSADYNELRDSRDLPLFNRAVRGGYPPGSTIKPVIAMAAIDSRTVPLGHRVFDPGYFEITPGGRRYRNWRRSGHGWTDLNSAMAQSSDTWFYDVGYRMGIDHMSEYLGMFGFGQVTALDTPEAIRGVLPSREWKRAARGEPWYPGDSVNLSIGQGYLVATPLQLAISAVVLANRGAWVQPALLQGVLRESDDGITLARPVLGTDAAPLPEVNVRMPELWEPLIQSMVDVVHGPIGTARAVGRGMQYEMAGKTGTAQVIGIAQDAEYDADAIDERHRDHALFIAFAPVDNPKIAVAVIVENTGGGSSTAAPVAREVMDAWLLDDYTSQLEWAKR